MTVWSNSNFYNFLPWAFAGMLGVPNNRLRMIPCAVGGSFGSKHFITKVIAIAGALSKRDRATGEVRRGPDGQHRGQRQRRLRPHLRRRARAVGRRRDARADPEDHRRLRGVLPVRPRPARQRHVPADRPVPDRQPALRRVLRADQQGPAGLLPRRGRRPGQLHPGTAGRRGRGGTGHRPGRAARAQLHPARPVPVHDPHRQRVRQRRLRGRPGPGHGAGRPQALAGRAATAPGRGPLPRHRAGQLPGTLRLQRQRVVVPLRQPAAGRDQHPGERQARRRRHGRGPGRAGLPVVGQQPGDRGEPGRGRGVRHRSGGRLHRLRRLDRGRAVGRTGRQPADDHAVRSGPRGVPLSATR